MWETRERKERRRRRRKEGLFNQCLSLQSSVGGVKSRVSGEKKVGRTADGQTLKGGRERCEKDNSVFI